MVIGFHDISWLFVTQPSRFEAGESEPYVSTVLLDPKSLTMMKPHPDDESWAESSFTALKQLWVFTVCITQRLCLCFKAPRNNGQLETHIFSRIKLWYGVIKCGPSYPYQPACACLVSSKLTPQSVLADRQSACMLYFISCSYTFASKSTFLHFTCSALPPSLFPKPPLCFFFYRLVKKIPGSYC